MKMLATLTFGLMFLIPLASRAAETAPGTLSASPQDRRNIEALLAAYTRAVSTKDQALFESLLLNKQIPFAYVSDDSAQAASSGTANYEAFRKAVFEGRPFKQIFRDVNIAQDGNLANVHLIFTNKDARSSSWGWKTLQLLKVNGSWKIASEFYTVH